MMQRLARAGRAAAVQWYGKPDPRAFEYAVEAACRDRWPATGTGSAGHGWRQLAHRYFGRCDGGFADCFADRIRIVSWRGLCHVPKAVFDPSALGH